MSDELELSKELLDAYERTVSEKILLFEKLIQDLRKEQTKPNLEALHFLVHKISGSAAFYGYQAVSSICQEWDIKLLKKIDRFPNEERLSLEELDLLLLKVKTGFNRNEKK